MDERLEKALNFSNYMVTLNNQKRLLKEQYQENLLYFDSGCQFLVTRELITFVELLINKGYEKDVVIIDDNEIPAKIADLNIFYENVLDTYFKASNLYFSEYDKLKKSRSVEKIIDYEKTEI